MNKHTAQEQLRHHGPEVVAFVATTAVVSCTARLHYQQWLLTRGCTSAATADMAVHLPSDCCCSTAAYSTIVGLLSLAFSPALGLLSFLQAHNQHRRLGCWLLPLVSGLRC